MHGGTNNIVAKGHADRVMMIEEHSLPHLVGLPAGKHSTWSQIFYQQE